MFGRVTRKAKMSNRTASGLRSKYVMLLSLIVFAALYLLVGSLTGTLGHPGNPTVMGILTRSSMMVLLLLSIVSLHSAIAKQQQLEAEVRKGRDRVQEYLDIAEVIIQRLDRRGKVVLVNRKACDLIGCEEKEIVGKNWFDNFVPERIREEMKSAFESFMAGDTKPSEHLESKVLTRAGEEKVISWHQVPVFNESNGIIACLASGVDITEHKRACETFEKSQQELALRNQIANVFLTVPDEQMYGEVLDILLNAMQSEYGTFGYIDENGARIVPSLTRGVWHKCNVRDKRMVFPRESWGNSTWPRAIREKKTICSNEQSVTTPEGHIKITRHVALPVIHHGEVIGLIEVANKKTDYSESDVRLLETLGKTIAPVLDARLHRDRRELEREKAEQTLREQTHALGERVKELRCLFQVTRLATDIQQPVEGLLRRALEAIAAAWQYPDITCVRIALEGREYVTSNWRETSWKQEAPITNCEGTVGTVEAAYLEEKPNLDEGPFLKEERELIDTLARLFGDFTERRRVARALAEQAEELIRSNAELESANQELVKLDRMKSDFVSNVSHELRTPLTAVKAYAETLLQFHSFSEEKRESFVKIILEQSDRLSALVDDLLDLSKIEAGAVEMDLAPISVERAIATAMQSVGPGAQEKGIEIHVRPPQEDNYVLADENRLVQVLVNLLNNSVKFTGQGGQTDVISVPVADSAGGSAQSGVKPTYLRITVSDNGMGIATEELDKIFDKFKQVAEKTRGKPAGTGLGLAICRNLVQAMHGRIWAESTVGKGSSFHFTLPLAHRPDPEEHTGQEAYDGQAVDELSVV